MLSRFDHPFLFAACQIGAEPVLKAELAARWPAFRFAYSRPGFLTFKLPDEPTEDLDLQSVFARAYGLSWGKLEGDEREPRIAAIAELACQRDCQRLHVWQRDQHEPGWRGYEVSRSEEILALERDLLSAWTAQAAAGGRPPPPTVTFPNAGDQVLDVIVIEDDLWWIGSHLHSVGRKSTAPHLPWPGGIFPEALPPHAVSRAYLKAAEAIAWSGLPLEAGQLAAELGASPGGASQTLLDRGLSVLGIDPAAIDPAVIAHPQFTHLRKRAHEVRRREFRKVRWLLADMNVAPQYTLDAIEAIVTHRETNVRGLLLTLKLLEWSLAAEIPQYVERVRSWGYARVSVRQLSQHRREFALAAE